MQLNGKNVIVTGAAAGIGKATAIACAKAGANVALVDIDEAGANKTAKEFPRQGRKSLVIKTDIANVQQTRAMVAQVKREFGSIDALANVAAIFPRAKILEVTEKLWDDILSVDLRGLFFCCQAAMHVMVQQKSGVIVNVASGAAFRPIEGHGVYSAAKGGVVALSRVLALEGIKHGVRTNVVAPGHTDTERNKAIVTPARRAGDYATLVGGRYIEPAEVASAIVFLCSDAASGINGAILNVCRGSYMIG
ncbi:MAG: SDR family oxidoreductase [Chloroflexi bacterium]|nr:SDR family oxidoreductase [Chloroflexota bacterium]